MAEEKSTESNTERELSLVGHLDELRTRLIICVGATFVLTFLAFFVSRPVLEFLIQPAARIASPAAPPLADPTVPPPPPENQILLQVADDGTLRVKDPEALGRIMDEGETPVLAIEIPAAKPSGEALETTPTAATRTLSLDPTRKRAELIYTHPLDPFMMPFKVAIVLGILLSLTIWVWQIWLFVAPGLTEKEKKVVGPLLCGAIFLFPLGSSFAYALLFLVIPVMRRYIVPGIDTLYTIRDYLRLMTNMMIVFGFVFELPLVVALLSRIGIVTPPFLRHYRGQIYVGLAVLSAFVTPADPFSMVLALIPLVVLFEVSIWISEIMTRMRDQDFDLDDEDGETA